MHRSPYGLTLAPACLLKAFVAGALSVLVFQYGLAAILYAAGIAPSAPYSMSPVPPLGVPQTVSSAFWGGLWGIVFLAILRNVDTVAGYWLTAVLLGALAVSAVLLFIVLPIKGRQFAAGWDLATWIRVIIVHTAFGLGTAFFLRLLSRRQPLLLA